MKKILLLFVSAILLSWCIVNTVNANASSSENTTKDICIGNPDLVSYSVKHQYINREGWGNLYTITVVNKVEDPVWVTVKPKGCTNGRTESATIQAFDKTELMISTGDEKPTGWHVEAHRTRR